MASLSGVFNVQQFTDLGALAANYRLYTYAPGTTTQKVAYTDAGGTIAQTYTSDGLGGLYIALNARGELPAPLFLSTGGYDLALKTPAGVTVWTRRAEGTADAAASYYASLLALLTNSTQNLYVNSITAGTGGVPYSTAGFISSESITIHAYYSFLANDIVAYAGGAPIYGRAAFDDNSTLQDSVNSDHCYSFQSYTHKTGGSTVGAFGSLYCQLDVQSGTATDAFGVRFENPLGAGTITNLYGLHVKTLTRGTNNWGVFVEGTKSFFGGPVWFGNANAPYGYIEYNGNQGHIQLVPRPTYAVKIGGSTGERKLIFGNTTDATIDASIENAASGDFVLTPRAGGPYTVSAASPVKMKADTVANIIAAYTNNCPYARAFATDATATTFNSVVAGGGTNKVPIWNDGTNWRIG